jgi:hypothetical protein
MVTDSEGMSFETRAEMRIMSEADGLGLCGCGDQDRLRELLVQYLSLVAERVPEADWTAIWHRLEAMGDAGMLLSFVCDAAGWTEHGGSVGGAWLTDEGRAALADLQS